MTMSSDTVPPAESVHSCLAPVHDSALDGDVDVDVLIVGGGILGLYQLYKVLDAGFTATLLEAGDGVGGTWYWNRYPDARFDSESYTYAYLFSKELFDDWEWQEHFAAQPEIERYLNHVVDRFDLRRHIRTGHAGDLGRVRRAVRHLDGARVGRRERRQRDRHRSAGPRAHRRDRRAVAALLPRRARS